MTPTGFRWSIAAVLFTASLGLWIGVPPEGELEADTPTCDVERQSIAGVWSRYTDRSEGAPVAFYYFHGDGKGLFRYGRIGLTNTHSFDYSIEGDLLKLHFRKTGRQHSVAFRIEEDESGHDVMVMSNDPEAREETRYTRETSDPVEHGLLIHDDLGPMPAGRMWIDWQKYATGGAAFSFYQFRPAGIDGRGVGWHHRGDFDDWSTESLVYRIVGDRIEMTFPLVGQHANTEFEIVREQGRSTMILESDPRDFWHHHAYRDAGRSFGQIDADRLLLGRLPQ